LPIKYLGMPLSANYLEPKHYSPLLTNAEEDLKVGAAKHFLTTKLIS